MSLSEQQPPFGVHRGLNIADPLANCETRADLKPGPGGPAPAELGQVSAERFRTIGSYHTSNAGPTSLTCTPAN
jgi:hypothetical protein